MTDEPPDDDLTLAELDNLPDDEIDDMIDALVGAYTEDPERLRRHLHGIFYRGRGHDHTAAAAEVRALRFVLVWLEHPDYADAAPYFGGFDAEFACPSCLKMATFCYPCTFAIIECAVNVN